eukprot:12684799-Ditylum_brightwellii.AAC.1
MTINNLCLPSFMMKRSFEASFDFLPRREIGKHIYQKGFWNQENIDAFWNKVGNNKVGVGQKKKPTFEYLGTVLEANKYEAPDFEVEVSSKKHAYLTKQQCGRVLELLQKHEGYSKESVATDKATQ